MSSYLCTKCPTALRNSTTKFPYPETPTSRKQVSCYPFIIKSKPLISQISLSSSSSTRTYSASAEDEYPTMSEIMEASRAQNLDLQLQKLGPFFRITARSLKTQRELGKAEGLIRVWFQGKILHLDSIRLKRETLGMEKSIFGIGLFIGAVAIRHGYDSGCGKAELLAIYDTELYHSKLVRFYTRIGFKSVHQVTGESLGDVGHMLVWGGVGTRMDANIEDLLVKWCTRFKPKS
ncbi:PREDICTED: uncharacterized protein LOC109230893 [Nicotiana attenuata]|uniref:Uncharacterized protein n=1 Tax=Nicotiana attenuata TaxID=49451 RepID=A0A1J6JG15_NICAT|nr:PREDICTED: uncharacterized protein LOC109230893 [Nicotiana attenuata]OIT08599.1 hypothetical protein A4A49_18396 [Nicotiana attenuata]